MVHTNIGQPIDTAIAGETNSIYLNWAVLNDGPVDVANRFSITVLVDGVEIPQASSFSVGLLSQFWIWRNDVALPRLTNGLHTIRLEIDSQGEIAESDETDNVLEQQIIITTTNIVPVRLYDAHYPADGAFAFSLVGTVGRRYQVEYSTSMTNWQALGVVTNTTGVAAYLDDAAGDERRLYRIRMLSP